MAGKELVPVGPAPKRPTGRPSTYSREACEEIIFRLSEGEPLAWICKDAHLPTAWAFDGWVNGRTNSQIPADEREALIAAYARAREVGRDALAAMAMREAFTPEEGAERTTEYGPMGVKVTVKKADALGHRRLKVDTILKLISQWDARKLGAARLAELEGGSDAPAAITGGLPDDQP